MKFRYLDTWDDPDNSKALIYFSQLLEEMLFDYSLDTYKPSALNTSLLCFEALSVIDDIDNGVVKKPNIEHVISEFTESLKRDFVAEELMSLDIKMVLSTLQNKTKSLSERKTVLELVWSQIKMPSYREKNEELLINAIKNNSDLNLIRALTRSYITTLINYGFTSSWLHEATINYFHDDGNRISNNDAIEDFINLFNLESKEFTAIYKATNIFSTISDSCEKLKMEVTKEVDDFNDAINEEEYLLEDNEVYVVVKSIKSKEIYSARKSADSRIELIRTFLTLFHHKEHPKWDDNCLMICHETNSHKIVKNTINPMHKCIDLRAKKASKRLNNFISEFSMDEISFPKFVRSSELHSLALSSDSIENQMINLWIALESLVPTAITEKSTIESIIDSCLPFLTLNYVNRLLDRLIGDMLNWNRHELNRSLRGIEGENVKTKLIKLLALDENKARRDRLDRSFRDFHLLRSRFFYIKSVVSSPKSILKTLESHEKRVAWQLRRIYRTRNIIVHSGRTPDSTTTLIENIHDYLDLIMSTLVSLASQGNIIHSVEQGFKYIEMNCAAHMDSLKNMNEEQYLSNIDVAAFKYAI